MNGIKAIETEYDDHLFRSRLEARWAVFFKTLGELYEYEKEGFDLGESGWYLPDFWLPNQRKWVEIKPEAPEQGSSEWAKAAALANQSNYYVAVLFGQPGEHGMYVFHPDGAVSLDGCWSMGYWPLDFPRIPSPPPSEPPYCLASGKVIHYYKKLGISIGYEHEVDTLHMHPGAWGGEGIVTEMFEDAGFVHHFVKDCIGTLRGAITAARQARFEHGERSPWK